jgi:FHS family L-fucose permease-like MFS transporter
MAIMGGAILPKVMGAVGDKYDLSRGFIVPLLCFGVIAAYGFWWPRLSGHEAMHGVSTTGGH